ncbi:MAG: hypothetical protein ACI4MK_12055 [Aristaeellaceae bacterium]
MRQRRNVLLVLLAVLLALPQAAAGDAGHQSYSYNVYGESVPCPAPYQITRVLDAASLGLDKEFNGLSDVFYEPDGSMLLTDSGNNRVLALDAELTLERVYTGVEGDGGFSPFNQPKAALSGPDGSIYVCDTYNARVVRMDREGRLMAEYGTPETDLIGQGVNYRPIKLALDDAGRMYVVATSINSGILVINPAGDFEGFLAAARVNPDPWRMMWKRLATREQRSRMEEFVPVEYNSIAMDSEGFLYATTAAVDSDVIIAEVNARTGSEEGAIVRRLNLMGQDILRRKGFYPQVGDVEDLSDTAPFYAGVSQVMDVATGEDGVYYMVGNNRSRIFAYDQDGYLLYVFSGPGTAQGGLMTPTALDVCGARMAVADRGSNLLTVYERTEYAALISQAIHCYNHGEYDQAAEAWSEVIRRNANFDIGYAGLGKAAYRNGAYREAMTWFEMANLQEWYGKAFEEYRKEVLRVWFAPAVLALIALGTGFVIRDKVRSRKEGNDE